MSNDFAFARAAALIGLLLFPGTPALARAVQAAPAFGQGPAQGVLTVDVGRGAVPVYLPQGYDAAQPVPLVLALHGRGSEGAALESFFGLIGLQDSYGYAYAAPDGTLDSGGTSFWNATDACCDFAGSGVDDVAYLGALLDEIEARVAVDRRSVHVIGVSNGAFMAHRLACEYAERIASIVSVNGAVFANAADCGASEPVHVVEVHGTLDVVVQYGGGTLFGVPYPSALATAAFWAARAGCPSQPVLSGETYDLEALLPGAESTVLRFGPGCAAGGSAELWTVLGGAHVPEVTQEFRVRALEHMLARPKPGIEATRECSPATANSTGRAGRIDASGSDVALDNALTLDATDLPPFTFGMFLVSREPGLVQPPNSQGPVCLGGAVGRFNMPVLGTGVDGAFTLDVDLAFLPNQTPVSAAPGDTFRFQAWFRDANPGPTSNLTDVVAVRIR